MEIFYSFFIPQSLDIRLLVVVSVWPRYVIKHSSICLQISVETARMLMDDGFTLSEASGAGRVIFDNQHPVSCWKEQGGRVEVSKY